MTQYDLHAPHTAKALFSRVEHLIEIKIVQSGNITGQYYPAGPDCLRLEKIVYPEKTLPFDVGVLPTALSLFDEPLSVLVLGSVSHPLHTEMEARLLGAIQRNGEAPILIATPTADERGPQFLEILNEKERGEILTILEVSRPGGWRWLTLDEVEPHLHEATLRHRQLQSDGKVRHLDPAWKPLNIGRPAPSFADAESYTSAEYTFYELPYRFQHYVGEFLAPDERILYAIRRLAMDSESRRSWLQREHLQEGVLILSDQRLIHLAELLPPGLSNVRYGYHTSIGVLEHLVKSSVSRFGKRSCLLTTVWRANGGETSIEWEMPEFSQTSLDELVSLLGNFSKNDPSARQIRRATPPIPPKQLPVLRDPASNRPEMMLPLNHAFSAALGKSLKSGEKAHAWALLPEWFVSKGNAQVLVVTGQRVLLLPGHSFEIPLARITSLEYTSSILQSSLVINFAENGVLRRKVIYFPYPAQDAFRKCFEAARRCMAILPSS